jgi:hypothetical protein
MTSKRSTLAARRGTVMAGLIATCAAAAAVFGPVAVASPQEADTPRASAPITALCPALPVVGRVCIPVL